MCFRYWVENVRLVNTFLTRQTNPSYLPLLALRLYLLLCVFWLLVGCGGEVIETISFLLQTVIWFSKTWREQWFLKNCIFEIIDRISIIFAFLESPIRGAQKSPTLLSQSENSIPSKNRLTYLTVEIFRFYENLNYTIIHERKIECEIG